MSKKTRIVKGIVDSYVVKESINSIDGKPFLEVYEHVDCGDETNGFIGEWICDIDCSMDDTDESILDAIDDEVLP